MGWNPRCYIPSYVEFSQQVPEKTIFDWFLPYKGVAAILVMGPVLCHQIFISLYLKAFIQTLVQIGTEVSEKIQFIFLYVRDLALGQGQEIALTFNTHISSVFN